MLSLRIVVCVLGAVTVLGQQGDISTRVRRALGPAGSGDAASASLAAHDFARVEDMLTGLVPATRSEHCEILALRGAVEFLDGKMNTAASDFQKASELGPLRDVDTFTFAMALLNLGDGNRARPLLTALAEQHPAQPIYIYWLGRLDYSQRRYKEAVQELQRASELDSGSARVWDSLGLAFDMQGLAEQALEAFQRAANLNRALGHPSPWPPHDLGFLLLRMDQLKEAEISLREALRYDPHFAQAHYHLGRVLEKEARETEAIEEYRSAISMDKSSADACYSLAMLYRKLHRDTEANATFAEYKTRTRGTPDTVAKAQ